jgi:Lar family restriction alleviation protein
MTAPLSENPKLLPCPFCGNDGSRRETGLGPKELEPAFVYVHCESCGAQGPCEGDAWHAVYRWNKRT